MFEAKKAAEKRMERTEQRKCSQFVFFTQY